jgi:RNA polymerase sigma factor (sigma-70 family)
MNQDVQWLQEYARTGSPQAFARLVEAHIALVYSAAMRQLRDHHLAEDVTQQVFMALAKRAPGLRRETVLASWLLVTTRYLARDSRRGDRRRAQREQRVAQMRPTITDPHDDTDPWPAIEPLLDDALCSLSDADRRAVTLRYLEGRNVEQVAAALQVSRDAAAQRLHRAVGRLRNYFHRRGAAVDRAALGSLMLSHAIRPTPPELAISIVKSAAAIHAGAGILTKGAAMAAISSKVKVLTAAAVLALSVGGTATVIYNVNRPKTRTVVLRPTTPVATPSDVTAVGQWWRPRLNQIYGLQGNEVVKHVAGPYIPERNAYFSDVMKEQPRMIKSAVSSSSATLFVFDQEPNWTKQQYEPFTFLDVVRVMTGLRSVDFEGLGDMGSMRLPGDWVMRQGIDVPQRMAALQSIVNSEFRKPLHLTPRTVERDVFVARGAIDIHSLPKEFNGCVALYIGERKGNGLSTSAGSSADFLGDVGEMLDTKVINETMPNKQLFWRRYVEAKNVRTSQTREELLKHISEQSGITFTKERRAVEVWFAEPAESAKNDTTASK